MQRIIEANALRADNPLGFMAALGIMQVARRVAELRGIRLYWCPFGASYAARFRLDAELTDDDFLKALISDLSSSRARGEFLWSPAIKTVKQAQFREVLVQANDAQAEWLSAFTNESANDDEDYLEATPFDMSVARQRFLADAAKLGVSLGQPATKRGPTTLNSYQEAVFGPWKYEDDQHSLGWDPSTLKMGAFTFKAPTALANTGVRAAVWLAIESLPYFQCAYENGLATVGWQVKKGTSEFRWPVWMEPLSHEEIEALLGWREFVSDSPSQAEMAGRGVWAIFGSAKVKPNKYLVTLRQVRLVASA